MTGNAGSSTFRSPKHKSATLRTPHESHRDQTTLGLGHYRRSQKNRKPHLANQLRGDLLIVAGKATDRIKPASRFLVKHNITVPDKLIFGAAIGIVTLTNIKPVEECGG